MKRIRVLLLTLVMTISMLAPEFSMLPVYADDQTPAAVQSEQNVDGVDAAGGSTAAAENADDKESGSDEAAGGPASGGSDGAATDTAAEDQRGAGDDTSADDQASEDGQKAGEDGDVKDQTGQDAGSDGLSDDVSVDTEETSVDSSEEEPEEPSKEFGSYDKLYMTELEEAKAISIPESMQEKISISHTKYGNGLLFEGTVDDLNSTYIELKNEFDFDSGSIGRLYFDGLKDKDRGMSVEVEIYLDDSKSPIASIPLKKQMGKKEWSNKGDQSISLGTSGISGKHKVAFLMKISGKDADKETSVMFRSIQFCKTTVPVMYFNIDESEGTIEAMNSSEDHSVECYGTVDLVVPDEFNDNEAFRDEYGTQKSKYGMDLEYIRGRGNSTWMDDKKPYKVKFDKKQDLFGFGKNAHWTLLANRYDNSLIRNRMTYWLGQQLGMEYTPQCVPVEVVMNGEYYGSYLLCEQIRVGEGRVEIDDLDKVKDIPAITDELIETGGYLLSMEWEEDEERAFVTKHNMQLFIESPDDNVAYFNEYIKAYTQKVENAIFGTDFKDEEGNPYTDYLDMNAAVDYWWVQEFSCNGDAYSSGSTYLYKKREKNSEDEYDPGKLYWGPLWDFDFVAWGDLDYNSDPPETLDYTNTPWFDEMKGDPEFIMKVKRRWEGGTDEDGKEVASLRAKLVDITKEGGLLDKYIKQMTTTYEYDHELWGPYESELTEYKAEIDQLRTWINKRIEYVDNEVAEMSTEPHKVKFMADGKLIKETEVTGVFRDSDFPEAPEKPGYVFMAWADEDGFDYEPGSRIREDLVLEAFYMEESEVIQPKDILFKHYDVYFASYAELGEDFDDWYWMESRVMPDGAFETGITWTSSNEEIATVDEEGMVHVFGLGDVTITATLGNGVSRSYDLHIRSYRDFNEWEEIRLNKTSLTLKVGEYSQVEVIASPQPCEEPDLVWVSANEDIAYVDDMGVVTAVAPGTTELLAINMMTRDVMKCRVNVKPDNNVGKTVKRSGSTYKITSDKKGNRKAMLVKAKNAKSVTVPAYIKYDGKKYSITRIKSKAFAKSKATKVTIKTKKLTKPSVKGSLKKSKVKTIKVKVSKKKKTNKTYVKKYKKFFTKKNAGKKVKVS